MEEVKSSGFTSGGSGAWKVFNTLLGSAGTAMGATALGSKCSEDKVREIIREENGMGHCGYGQPYNGCSENSLVNRYELQQSQRIAELEADKSTDAKLLTLYNQMVVDNKAILDKVNTNNETIYKELVAQREAQLVENGKLEKDIALNKQASDYQFIIANKEFSCINGRIDTLTGRVDAITREIVPISAICPQPMSGCVPVSFDGQIVDTRDTNTSTTVVAARTAAKA